MPPPSLAEAIAELLRLPELGLAAFDARMQLVISFCPKCPEEVPLRSDVPSQETVTPRRRATSLLRGIYRGCTSPVIVVNLA